MILLIGMAIILALGSAFTHKHNSNFVFSFSVAMGAAAYFCGINSNNFMFEYNLAIAIAMIAINLCLNLFAHFGAFSLNPKYALSFWVALAFFLIANGVSVFIFLSVFL